MKSQVIGLRLAGYAAAALAAPFVLMGLTSGCGIVKSDNASPTMKVLKTADVVVSGIALGTVGAVVMPVAAAGAVVVAPMLLVDAVKDTTAKKDPSPAEHEKAKGENASGEAKAQSRTPSRKTRRGIAR